MGMCSVCVMDAFSYFSLYFGSVVQRCFWSHVLPPRPNLSDVFGLMCCRQGPTLVMFLVSCVAAKAQPQMVEVLSMWANMGVAELGGDTSSVL